jgi:hypothetical protein
MHCEAKSALKAVFEENSYWVPLGDNRTDGQTTAGF